MLPVRQVKIGDRNARIVSVSRDSYPGEILTSLIGDVRPRLAIGISGGGKHFPDEHIAIIKNIFCSSIVPLIQQYDALVIDGGTNVGVMKILGEAVQALIPPSSERRQISESSSWSEAKTPLLIGFVPESLIVESANDKDSSFGKAQLDLNHPYFVLVRDATEWGDEVECMFSCLDFLHQSYQVPVVCLVVNGGRITLKETFHAAKQHYPIVILQGTQRASQLIVAALEDASEETIQTIIREQNIAATSEQEKEVLNWLVEIRQANPAPICLDPNNSPDSLKNCISNLISDD